MNTACRNSNGKAQRGRNSTPARKNAAQDAPGRLTVLKWLPRVMAINSTRTIPTANWPRLDSANICHPPVDVVLLLQGLITHSQIAGTTRLLVAGSGLVIGIEQVADTRLQPPGMAEPVLGAQVDGVVAVQLDGVGRVIPTPALGMQAGTDANAAKAAIYVQAEHLFGAA